MNLSFGNHEIARLCNSQARLDSWAGGPEAAALRQLLNELDCADTLGLLESLPYILLTPARNRGVAVNGAYDARALIAPDEDDENELGPSTEAALIVALAVGERDFNPEGERWPRASAMSQTTR